MLGVKARNFPLWLMFCLIPAVSFVTRITGLGVFNYDVVWVVLLMYSFFMVVKTKKLHNCFNTVFVFIIIGLLLKYIVPLIIYTDIQMNALIMDGKWFIYLFFATFWIKVYGYPDLKKLYKYGVFFSILYIANTLIMILKGTLSREGLLMESNYDGFMILMVYCISNTENGKSKIKDGILLLATFLTLSRTGFLSLFAILGIRLVRKNIFYLIPVVPIVMAFIIYGTMIRGEESVNHLDRFVYWTQAYEYFKHTDMLNVIFGHTVGVPLKMPVMPEFYWSIDLFSEMRDVKGIFPFMFHSAYIRIAMTWGIPVCVLLVCLIIRKFLLTKSESFKEFIVLTLVQSFSLSTLTLPNVSVLWFLLLMVFLAGEKRTLPQKRLLEVNR